VISIAADILGVKTYTLRYYERVGIIKPGRSQGNIRLYSESDLELLRKVRNLTDELGVNIAGVEVILSMLTRIKSLQIKNEELENELVRLKGRKDNEAG
ncbi:MAG: MerR family transcriptional regulator, partial [Chloroflexi bacterium]|nr:MerR family transcriptional regulator [Chloroflexota bacterium]